MNKSDGRRKRLFTFIAICIVPIIIALLSEILFGKGIPFLFKQTDWAIGVYTGVSPFCVSKSDKIKNPVITNRNITGVDAIYVADPFMIYDKDVWYMFFEVFNSEYYQGDIGLAISKDAINWKYQQIVLNERFHLSYPLVFKWEEQYYMIPESGEDSSVRLYEAINFPKEWKLKKTLLTNFHYQDSSIVYFQNHWWIFTTPTKNYNILVIYYSDDLCGEWTPHKKNPIIQNDANISLSGGRPLKYQGKLYRFAQDDEPVYGNQVRMFEITKISENEYQEKEIKNNPIIKASGKGWNKKGMHHIDLHEKGENNWIACVDGFKGKRWIVRPFKKKDIKIVFLFLFLNIAFILIMFKIIMIKYPRPNVEHHCHSK